MARTLTWLHLSDLHACKPRTGWDAKRVSDSLCADLKKLQEQKGLCPDLIFFTGDAAFGQIGNQRGEMIADQFREAHDFLEKVRTAFDPAIAQRNVFLVPGNHDVNRTRISEFETLGLEQTQSLDKITGLLQSAGLEWERILGRLDDYAGFLKNYGYDHLLTGRKHLIYADAREVAGIRVGIAGLNSAWSSTGAGRTEKGKLWMAGRFQLETLMQAMPPNDFAIALMHHPPNWLVPEENPEFDRDLEHDFPFILHGHEHQDFVRLDGSTGHVVVSAGACHEWSDSPRNGYNLVRLNFETQKGEVWLRQYDHKGKGWVPRCIANRTDDVGCWHLNHLAPWMEKMSPVRSSDTPNDIAAADLEADIAVENGDTIPSNEASQSAIDYEARYRKAVVDGLDYVQLFGIEVPRESKEYSLTVAYVSLNLADEETEALETAEEDEGIDLKPTSLPVEAVFDNLGIDTRRLLIRGAAGCGKTTLLRWAAVQAGKPDNNKKKKTELLRSSSHPRLDLAADMEDMTDDSRVAVQSDWRHKVPFVIRLRDCPDGQLPRPGKFPLLLARELPDPPQGWVDDVLSSGRALIMFDGVDEVPPQKRDEVMRGIRQLIQTYGDNYYVVTTRPEAVERVEFCELGFESARVEPMSPVDRNTFIDRWHEAMEVRLRNWNEAADLRPLAKRLKQRLEETPAVARLTVNPLLCAVVCALHRQRNENLPETPVDLCEKLCEMLLDRRDKERPGFDARRNIDETYGSIEFRVRKGLLSKLAHHMVLSGVSAISEAAADEQLAEALQSYGLDEIKPTTLRQALVDRSGMLQESSEQRIEFLHNTLKEFLAAERFANAGDVQSLTDHVDDPAWQPVILFAVALPRDGSSFATELVREVCAQTPLKAPGKGRAKADKAEAAMLKSKQFFFFRCVTNAYQLKDQDITKAFRGLSRQLLPPRNKTSAEALATCGEAIIPYLRYQKQWSAAVRAACVRTLGLIGGSRALKCLEEYCFDETNTVREELVGVMKDLQKIPLISQTVEQTGALPAWNWARLTDASALANLTNLTMLDLRSTKVSDVSALANLTNLKTLRLSSTLPSGLNTLTNLSTLDLSYTSVSDVNALANLTKLSELNLRSTKVSDVSALANLTNLKILRLSSTLPSGLNTLTNLSELDLGSTEVSDVSALANLTNLKILNLYDTKVSDISALTNLTNLSTLNLRYTKVSDVSVLANLTNLSTLNLRYTKVSDVSVLANLTNLSTLNLRYTKVSDVSVLANLTNLKTLNLYDTKVSDVSALANLPNLSTLNLRSTLVSDVSALANLPNLSTLNLRSTLVSDVSALANLPNLSTLNLSSTSVSDVSVLANLPNLSTLDLYSTKVSEIDRLQKALPRCRIHYHCY